MQLLINNRFNGMRNCGQYLKQKPKAYRNIIFFLCIGLFGCSDFIEADPPKNVLISKTVFNDPATVESALANLYFNMREQGLVSGSFGLTTAMGIYSDELDYFGFIADYAQLYHHNLTARNSIVTEWWRQAYNLIYGANDIINGVENSDKLSSKEKNRFKGQALFVRAYVHSLLVSLFGDVPYITTTNYLENNTVSRRNQMEVYENIISDLNEAMDLLETMEPISNERVVPGYNAVKALLARIYLYTENWEMAASLSTELIATFKLEKDLNKIFLKESPETIWQLKADEKYPKNTREAEQLIIQNVPGQTYALTDDLLASFEDGDQRFDYWVGSVSNEDNTINLFYAHKYKAGLSATASLEYSILFRLAEQFLIRAEARAHLGDILGSKSDLNVIRSRAGLPDITVITISDLLNAIFQERRIELFTEQSHRWFDLKRIGKLNEVMSAQKPNWRASDSLLPIPETELEINSNLLPQNSGY